MAESIDDDRSAQLNIKARLIFEMDQAVVALMDASIVIDEDDELFIRAARTMNDLVIAFYERAKQIRVARTTVRHATRAAESYVTDLKRAA